MLFSTRGNQRSLSALVLIIALTLTSTLASAQDADVEMADPVVKPVKLTTITAPQTSVARVFFGQVKARETVDLSFDVGGKLIFSPLAEGSRVKKGDVIGRLEQDNFERAITRAEISVAQAERTLKRAKELADRRVGPQSAADDALSAKELSEVSLNDAREALADAVLTAPFDGLVASRLVPTFSTIAPGQPILRLHDMSETQVEVSVPENLVTRIEDFMQVRFQATLPNGDKVGPLTLREYRPETSQVGQSYRVTLALPENLPSLLLPGASLSVTAQIAVEGQALPTIPASAIVFKPDRSTVVMIYNPSDDSADGAVAEAAVNIVSSNGSNVQVDGLHIDTQIVATGGHLLEDGQAVRPFLGYTVGE